MHEFIPRKGRAECHEVHFGPHTFDILRLDKLDNSGHGNKWFKLKYNIKEALREGADSLVTFGGAYSNHIAALAEAGRITGIPTVGIIRGEEHLPLNPTLHTARENGMKLLYLDRKDYRQKDISVYSGFLRKQFAHYRIIPEGGSNQDGVRGAMEILDSVPRGYAHIFVATGTGGTAAGLLKSGYDALIHCTVVLKGYQNITSEILRLAGGNPRENLLLHPAHFGGYARINDELIDFMRRFRHETGIVLDPVYTAKAMWAMMEWMRKTTDKGPVLFIHTGGIQGIRGMEERLDIQIYPNTSSSI